LFVGVRVGVALGGLWALEWAYHIVINLALRKKLRNLQNLNSLPLIVSVISAIDSASDPDQEASETLPSASYIPNESSIPFYSTSYGYNKEESSTSTIRYPILS